MFKLVYTGSFCLLFATACSHKNEARYATLLKNGQCEEASLHLPYTSKVQSAAQFGLLSSTDKAVRILSVDSTKKKLIYINVQGILIPTIECLPPDADFSGISVIYRKCFEHLHQNIPEIRCPDLEREVIELRELANCYENKGDLTRAREQRSILLDVAAFSGCLSQQDLTR